MKKDVFKTIAAAGATVLSAVAIFKFLKKKEETFCPEESGSEEDTSDIDEIDFESKHEKDVQKQPKADVTETEVTSESDETKSADTKEGMM